MYKQMTNTKSWLMSEMVSNTKRSCVQSKRWKKNDTTDRIDDVKKEKKKEPNGSKKKSIQI